MSYTPDNISQWIEDLSTKSPYVQYRAYCAVDSVNNFNKFKDFIIECCGLKDRLGCKDVTVINDDLAIVHYTDTKNQNYYIPYVDGHKSCEWFLSFDFALLAALSLKHTSDTTAATYAAKVLEVSTV